MLSTQKKKHIGIKINNNANTLMAGNKLKFK